MTVTDSTAAILSALAALAEELTAHRAETADGLDQVRGEARLQLEQLTRVFLERLEVFERATAAQHAEVLAPSPGEADAMGLSLLCAVTRRRAQDAAIAYVTGDINDAQAFEALCAAVAHHVEVRKERQSLPRAVFPFGPHKGQALGVGTTEELASLERYLSATLDAPDKVLFKRRNLALRAAVLAELHKRKHL